LSKKQDANHAPNDLYSHITIIGSVVRKWEAVGFITDEALVFAPCEGGFVCAGFLCCVGGLVIRVEKRLEVQGGTGTNPVVQTLDYAYNVSLQGSGVIFRYDNSHGPPPDYPKDDPVQQRETWHHRHKMPFPPGAEGKGTVDWNVVWPHLSDVIQEANDWYEEHGEPLGLVGQFADMDTCDWGRFVYLDGKPAGIGPLTQSR